MTMDAALDTYSLRDFLMFSADTYDALHDIYLQDIQPAPWIFAALTAAGLISMFSSHRLLRRLLFFTAGLGWVWLGLVYHRVYYEQISIAAPYLATACTIQGLLLIVLTSCGLLEIKVGRRSPTLKLFAGDDDPPLSRSRIIMLVLFAIIAFCPLAGWSGLPGESMQLYGYGPSPTYLGTLILLAIPTGRVWPRILCAIIPALGAAFQVLTHIALVRAG